MGDKKARPRVDWSQAEKLFGRVSDAEIARKLGVAKSSVSRKRKSLGIEQCANTSTSRTKRYDTKVPDTANVSRCLKGPDKKNGEYGNNVRDTGNWDEGTQAVYLKILSETGAKAHAAEVAGISRTTIVRARDDNPTFAALEAEAIELYRDVIRLEVHRRAIEGWEEEVGVGNNARAVKKYSDTLLTMLAKAKCPEFKDKVQIDANVKSGVMVVPPRRVTNTDFEKEFSEDAPIH